MFLCTGVMELLGLPSHSSKLLRFLEIELLKAAMDAAEVVWNRGLLKQFGICHGISGNVHVFLSVYRLTGIVEYLYRAKAFACFLLDRAHMLMSTGEMHGGDNAYLLFEGMGGMAHLFLDMVQQINGRAVMTMARKKNPQNPQLWLAAVRAESQHGYKKEGDILMAKELQECPTSGILWAVSIEMVPRRQQKMKSRDAYKNCGADSHVLTAVGRIVWHDRKVDKARSWFNRAVTLAPDIGEFWALYYKFELQHCT